MCMHTNKELQYLWVPVLPYTSAPKAAGDKKIPKMACPDALAGTRIQIQEISGKSTIFWTGHVLGRTWPMREWLFVKNAQSTDNRTPKRVYAASNKLSFIMFNRPRCGWSPWLKTIIYQTSTSI